MNKMCAENKLDVINATYPRAICIESTMASFRLRSNAVNLSIINTNTKRSKKYSKKSLIQRQFIHLAKNPRNSQSNTRYSLESLCRKLSRHIRGRCTWQYVVSFNIILKISFVIFRANKVEFSGVFA